MSRLPAASSLFRFAAFAGVVVLGLALFFAATPAFAQQATTLGAMTNRFYDSLVNLQTFLSMLSYILGIFFSITGMLQLRDYADDPGRNPLRNALLRLGAAAFFVFTPTLATLLINSLGGDGVGGANNLNFMQNSGVNISGTTASGGGLEAMIVRFVMDFAGPFLDNLLPFIAYISGVILMLIGLKRLALANGDGPQAPGGMGTMGTFAVAAALMSFGYVVYTFQMSLFGTNDIINSPTFMTYSANNQLSEQANRAMWGVFIFLRVVGYISMLRALFMMRAAAEGGNVETLAIGTHLVAGALLINATGFVLMIQDTFIDPSSHILQR